MTQNHKIELNPTELQEVNYELSDLKGVVAILDAMSENPSIMEHPHLNKSLRLLSVNIQSATENIDQYLTKDKTNETN